MSTRRPTPRVDRSCTVLTRWVRLRPRRSSFQTDDHGARPERAAGSCRAPSRTPDAKSRRRRGRRRRQRPAARRATGPATGSRPPLRRERRRSACVVNGRLRHNDEGAFRPAPPCVVSRVGFSVLQTSRERAWHGPVWRGVEVEQTPPARARSSSGRVPLGAETCSPRSRASLKFTGQRWTPSTGQLINVR